MSLTMLTAIEKSGHLGSSGSEDLAAHGASAVAAAVPVINILSCWHEPGSSCWHEPGSRGTLRSAGPGEGRFRW